MLNTREKRRKWLRAAYVESVVDYQRTRYSRQNWVELETPIQRGWVKTLEWRPEYLHRLPADQEVRNALLDAFRPWWRESLISRFQKPRRKFKTCQDTMSLTCPRMLSAPRFQRLIQKYPELERYFERDSSGKNYQFKHLRWTQSVIKPYYIHRLPPLESQKMSNNARLQNHIDRNGLDSELSRSMGWSHMSRYRHESLLRKRKLLQKAEARDLMMDLGLQL